MLKRCIGLACCAMAFLSVAVGGCSSTAPTALGTGGKTGGGGATAASGGATVGSGGINGGSSSGGAPIGSGGSATGGQAAATGGVSGTGGVSAGNSGGSSGGSGGLASGGTAQDAGSDSAATGGRGGTGTGGAAPSDAAVDRGDGAPLDASGAGGAVAFAPCPATGACLIMPLGDSITDGFGVPGGYRIELFRQSLTDRKQLSFVGRKMNGPTSVTVGGQMTTFPRANEGYSGYTIDDGTGVTGISPLVDGAISVAHPHIVLLMIGTNDVNRSIDLANAPVRLRALIERITADSPAALLVIARITPTTNDTTNARIQTYNNAIPGLVQSLVNAGKHILVVDMYAAFTANTNYKTTLMNDELHPNPAGYLVMAQTWYATLKSYLH